MQCKKVLDFVFFFLIRNSGLIEGGVAYSSIVRTYLGQDAPDDVLGAGWRGERSHVPVVRVGAQPQRPQAHVSGGNCGTLLRFAALRVQHSQLVLNLSSSSFTNEHKARRISVTEQHHSIDIPICKRLMMMEML